MPVTLNNLNSTPRSDTLNAVFARGFPALTLGAGVVNSTTTYGNLVGVNFKVRKVAVYFTSIDNITGTDSFNIVVGNGAYSQNNAAPNDNSFDPSAATTVGVNTVIGTGVTPVLGGVGYPTNVAVAGMSVFATDVPFNAANFPNIATGTGAYGILIPTNYDAVYPGNLPITIRVTTVAGTGAIGNLSITLVITPVRLRPAPPGAEAVAPLPGVDY